MFGGSILGTTPREWTLVVAGYVTAHVKLLPGCGTLYYFVRESRKKIFKSARLKQEARHSAQFHAVYKNCILIKENLFHLFQIVKEAKLDNSFSNLVRSNLSGRDSTLRTILRSHFLCRYATLL